MPSTDEAVWRQVRAGRGPSEQGVEEVAHTQLGRLGEDGAAGLREELHRSVLGLGPLQDLLADETVTDILVNGASGIWVDAGEGLRRADGRPLAEEAARRLAVRLSALAGKRLDDANPAVDGLLPGGIRLHAVLPPLVEGGAHLSLRVPRRLAPDLAELQRLGMCPSEVAAVLAAVVAQRLAFVVTGGTGTGKTTLLGAMLGRVAGDERIVVVEDVRELAIQHPHVIRLQGRPPNIEGRGEITLTTLVRQSLRMRPDRLVVGEVRGPEVRELLAALNTGHEGGCGTLHANASADVVSRFEALGALAGLGPPAVHAQVGSALDVVVHLARDRGRRYVREVAVLTRGEDERVRVEPAMTVHAAGHTQDSGWPVLARRLDLPPGSP
ncbi:TadA family conjugal transfer-associated ATPase [Ornithinicoccus hortensis]|uniref:Pilus assembly protein CpaF n=1 Tax=Ornithinicoccus hortensis TaxID=82346 RepID=A0A542YW28_9MICO|nr:TadA family conjugal transfer-associated ATPase [Ornithinicoccus hortensis]TQL52281.1 pilus assembly protein CpaF [Ornithinicoccus hortensis]